VVFVVHSAFEANYLLAVCANVRYWQLVLGALQGFEVTDEFLESGIQRLVYLHFWFLKIKVIELCRKSIWDKNNIGKSKLLKQGHSALDQVFLD
jgi:hypothetical protein